MPLLRTERELHVITGWWGGGGGGKCAAPAIYHDTYRLAD